MVSAVQQIESLYQRLEKARQIVAEGKVHPVLNLENHFVVEASNGKGFYLVNGACNCPDAQDRSELHRGYCKHRLASVIYKEAQQAASKATEPKASRKLKAVTNGTPQVSTSEEREQHEREIADLFPTEKEKAAHSLSS